MSLAFLNGFFNIQCAYHAIFGGGNWEVYKWGGAFCRREFLCGSSTFLTLGTPGGWFFGVAAEAAVLNDLHIGKQCGKGTGRGRFGSTAFTTDQHAADAGI